jgi:hypothetical protein
MTGKSRTGEEKLIDDRRATVAASGMDARRPAALAGRPV